MLIDKLLFSDRVPGVLKKSLDFQASRHLLISGNIGNADTPGYKASDIDFAGQLREALGSDNQVNMKTTDSKHIGPSDAAINDLQPEVIEEPDAARSNGNNVNMDKEMGKLAENQIMYNAVAQIMTKRGSTLRAAITEFAQQ
ncbi:MAG: flagellar basal body rod protein FlgB [Nitrospinae bacterium]|nr:flagellar basal body rod protein FlgB [Nitrospinota bacterium]